MELVGLEQLSSGLAGLSIASLEPLVDYFPPNFKIYEFSASANKISKELRLEEISEWLRLKENSSFVFQCLLCRQEMGFAVAFRRGNYVLNRSHLLTKKHRNNVKSSGQLVGLLFNSQKFVMCLATELNTFNIFEIMSRVSRREEASIHPNALGKVFCENFAMYSFDRNTKKLIDLDRKGDLALFMKAEVRPLFSMYCLFCNAKLSSYSQVILHLNSIKHKKKVGTERCAIIAVKEFNIFIACSLNKLSSFIYLTYLNSFLEEIIIGSQGSVIISGFHSLEGKPEPRKDVGVAVEVSPIVLPDGTAKNESVKIQTRFHSFIEDAPAESGAVARQVNKTQRNVTIYEFSDDGFREHYADNLIYSLLNAGTRVWCSRCQCAIYTLEQLETHLASPVHAANVRNNEQIGFMCHHCNVFYIELKGDSLSHIHTSMKNKNIISQLENGNVSAVSYENPLIKNLNDAYKDVLLNLGEACNFSCLLCADLTKKRLVYLASHVSGERHRVREDAPTNFALCTSCNTIYIHEERAEPYFFREHFALHLNAASAISFKLYSLDGRPPTDITVDRSTLSEQNICSVTTKGTSPSIKVSVSKYMSQLVHSGVCGQEFLQQQHWTKEILSHFIRSLKITKKFVCQICTASFTSVEDFMTHIFLRHSASFFLKYCDVCAEIIISNDLHSLREHFKGSHHIKMLLDLAGISLSKANVKERMLTECQALFSSKEQVSRTAHDLLEEMNSVWLDHETKFRRIEADLKEVLSSLPNLKVELFGSQVTGLATRSSDFDICIGVGLEKFSDVDLLLNRASGRGKFTVLKSLPDVSVPIIKIFHMSTQSQCDINFSSRDFETHSSRLIKLYVDMDRRVLWLLGLIREWSSKTELWSSHALPSPVITWLVLFYLMQPEVRLVPCVSRVLASLGGVDALRQAGLSISPSLKGRCMISELELAEGFFHYYSLMKFSENKLCPRSGLVVPRTADPPADMLIEDPLSMKNVAQRATLELTSTFQVLCYQTLHMPWRD